METGVAQNLNLFNCQEIDYVTTMFEACLQNEDVPIA